MKFLSELNKRNRILYLFGWLCWIGAFVCIILSQRDETVITNVNAWIKPLKFFLSIAIFSWTMAWYLFYLNSQRKVKYYSLMVVIVMSFELFVVVFQASRGTLSHFNIRSSFDMMLFNLMGVAIVILTVWTLVMGIYFFRQKNFTIPKPYLWGIRLGILFFVIFSFEGGIMAANLSHSVGGPDGSPGLPIVNWSRVYGDLRVAHFFGLHALQILPLVGYYIVSKKGQLFLFATLYFLMVVSLLVLALYKNPIF